MAPPPAINPSDIEFPEGNDEIISKGPCPHPNCGSSDAYTTYADGHTYCFSCGTPEASPQQGRKPKVQRASPRSDGGDSGGGADVCTIDPTKQTNPYRELTKRRIHPDTLRKYGYFVGGFKGQEVQVAPYYDMQGEFAGQKVRLPNKDFVVLKARPDAPSVGVCQLFGRHVYGDRYDRKVIITEGELDALSVAQVMDFKVAVVSVNTGSKGAAKCLKENYLWVDRFQEVVLWFDDDEPGRAATEECAKLFKVGKVRIAKVDGYKDASEVLQANKPGDIKEAIFMATAWRPRGIVNAKDSGSSVTAPKEKVLSFNYPPQMEKLQEMTGGMRVGEVIYHVAGTGVGKSTALREIQYHLVEQGVKIAVLSFEDTLRDMQFGIMSIAANERLHLVPEPDVDDPGAIAEYDAKMLRIHGQVFGGGLVELFDPERAEWSMDSIMSYVRYCARALDCAVVFVDPLSFVAAGLDLTADERRVLDKVAMQFAMLCKELGIHVQISHHLRRIGQGVPHEEGASTSLNELRSSGGLANFAMGVIGWERNNQAEGDAWRVTQSRIIKPVRRTGKAGLADILYYGENGRLIKSPLPFPPIGKPKGEAEGRNQSIEFPTGDY